MEFYALKHILFWIAVTLCPQDTSQITVTGPDKTWTWAMQPSGWLHSVDNSLWAAEGTTITSRSSEEVDEHDVVRFVKGIPEHDWARSTSLKLGRNQLLTKQGDTFVYTLDEGDSTAKRFVIAFKRAPAQSHLFRDGITFSAPAVQESREDSDTFFWDLDFGNRPAGPSGSANGKPDLREAVEQAFDARQETQRAEVERIRRELAEIEAAIEAREKHREQIINQRIQELMYPERRPLQDSLPLETGPGYALPRVPLAGALKELEGTWRFVTAESSEEGWDQPLDVVRKWVWWIRGANLHGPGPVPGFTDATFVLDPHRSPKAIDISYPDGTTLLGIYERKDDRLTVCLRSHAKAARGRPEKFTFEGDAGLSLLILRKVEGDGVPRDQGRRTPRPRGAR